MFFFKLSSSLFSSFLTTYYYCCCFSSISTKTKQKIYLFFKIRLFFDGCCHHIHTHESHWETRNMNEWRTQKRIYMKKWMNDERIHSGRKYIMMMMMKSNNGFMQCFFSCFFAFFTSPSRRSKAMQSQFFHSHKTEAHSEKKKWNEKNIRNRTARKREWERKWWTNCKYVAHGTDISIVCLFTVMAMVINVRIRKEINFFQIWIFYGGKKNVNRSLSIITNHFSH